MTTKRKRGVSPAALAGGLILVIVASAVALYFLAGNRPGAQPEVEESVLEEEAGDPFAGLAPEHPPEWYEDKE